MNLDSGSLLILMLLIMMTVQHEIHWAWIGLVLLLIVLIRSKGLLVMILIGVATFVLIQAGPSFTEYWWIILLALVGALFLVSSKEKKTPGYYMPGME